MLEYEGFESKSGFRQMMVTEGPDDRSPSGGFGVDAGDDFRIGLLIRSATDAADKSFDDFNEV